MRKAKKPTPLKTAHAGGLGTHPRSHPTEAKKPKSHIAKKPNNPKAKKPNCQKPICQKPKDKSQKVKTAKKPKINY
jgi:hypothetical protein